MKSFLLPPLGLFILAVLLFAIRHRARGPVRVAALLLGAATYLLCTPFVGERLMALHQIHPPLAPAEAEAVATPDNAPGAIVVLSAGRRETVPEPGGLALDAFSLARTHYAAYLHQRTGQPLLVSGGTPDARWPPIARAMAETLRQRLGTPVRWVEPEARDTWQNARYAAALLRQADIDCAYLVTHAWHMPRAVGAFRAHGLAVVPAPMGVVVPASPDLDSLLASHRGLAASYYGLHELLGRLAYAWLKSPAGAAPPPSSTCGG